MAQLAVRIATQPMPLGTERNPLEYLNIKPHKGLELFKRGRVVVIDSERSERELKQLHRTAQDREGTNPGCNLWAFALPEQMPDPSLASVLDVRLDKFISKQRDDLEGVDFFIIDSLRHNLHSVLWNLDDVFDTLEEVAPRAGVLMVGEPNSASEFDQVIRLGQLGEASQIILDVKNFTTDTTARIRGQCVNTCWSKFQMIPDGLAGSRHIHQFGPLR
ncbi:hypothetical protein AB1L42_21900 [Thalassoglobus sp. JC818]|uniref:hypothetical protein n=1 Tax=Thalassoglobus sp. JC818 TaxID=3232136 RepID=UPI00345B4057